MLHEYWRLHRVRTQRRREAALRLPAGARVVGIDIDGVLADYVGGLVTFLNRRLGTRFSTEQVVRPNVGRSLDLAPVTYQALKREFRDSGLEGAGCSPVPGAIGFVQHLARQSYYICLLTGRPGHAYRRLVPDTLEWLERHGVPFHYCLFDARKTDRLIRMVHREQLVAFIEDSPEQALRIAELGVPVWLRRTPYSGGVSHPDVRYFDDFDALRAEF